MTNELLTEIRRPIEVEMAQYVQLFTQAMSHPDGLLHDALAYVRQRVGKQMRPILTMLIAKSLGRVGEQTYRAAVGLELLHTASLVHDDVVDRADRRRGQRSVNAVYDNRIAVLVGDYILSTALVNVSMTQNTDIVKVLSELGQTLSDGEILQITSNGGEAISEKAYYSVIQRKTAALFEACCAMGAMSADATQEQLEAAKKFGKTLGIIFQIKDDIFDYFDSEEIGKPTGNDMAEGKLTLPAIHVLLSSQDARMMAIAHRVKALEASPEDIAHLVKFTIEGGGIDYAYSQIEKLRQEAMSFVNDYVTDGDLKRSLTAYLDYCGQRKL